MGGPRRLAARTKVAHVSRGRSVERQRDHSLRGTISVPVAPSAQMRETVRPIAEVVAGGNNQLFSPAQEAENASVHSASG